MLRGALLCVEGPDRSGKSCQTKKLINNLKKNGKECELMRFPNRESPTGKLIDDYLNKKIEMEVIIIIFLMNMIMIIILIVIKLYNLKNSVSISGSLCSPFIFGQSMGRRKKN